MSKILRGDAVATPEPVCWKATADEPERGLRPFTPRQIRTEKKPPEPSRPPEPKADPKPAPPPPPPDLDKIRKQAFQEGFQAGEQAAREQAESAYQSKLQTLDGFVGGLPRFKQELRAEASREVVGLAFTIARRILRRELHLDPQMTLAMVRACLEQYPAVEVRRIRAHPEEADLIREHFGKDLEIVADQGVGRGGAVLETEQGRLDAQLETQLDELQRGLADV